MKDAKGTRDGKSRSDDERKRRLAEQLRANLKRRKARTRARKTGKDVSGSPMSDEENGKP